MQIDNKLTIGLPIGIVLAVAAYFGNMWIDSNIITKANAESNLDQIYVRQDVFKQSVDQRRIWDLMDKIENIKSNAIDRELTPKEKRDILRWENEIKKLESGK